MEKGAQFSPCRRYRYALWRTCRGLLPNDNGYAMFVGLNPSTADEYRDDPTVRRCVAFAQEWGYDALCMTNLFAFRATDPAVMMRAEDPVGPDNDRFLNILAASAGVIVAAWGVHGSFLARGEEVRAMLPPMSYLRLTRDGSPAHPLYLPKTLRPVEWVTIAESGCRAKS